MTTPDLLNDFKIFELLKRFTDSNTHLLYDKLYKSFRVNKLDSYKPDITYYLIGESETDLRLYIPKFIVNEID